MKNESRFWSWYAGCYDGLLKSVPYRRLLEQIIGCVPVGAARYWTQAVALEICWLFGSVGEKKWLAEQSKGEL